MAHTTLRLKRIRNAGDPLRSWLAIALIAVSAIAAYFIFTRDIEWSTRNRDERRQGLTAVHNGNFEEARAHFQAALANHPYDWATHLSLADVLYHHLNDHDGALRHYLYALAYTPESAINEPIQAKIDIIRLMRSGELEDPRNALEDMFVAVENKAERLFARRLSPPLKKNAEAFWNAWLRRGRGKITFCNIKNLGDGFYDAMVELEFPDDTSMSLHLQCPLRDLWRLELAFP